VRTRESGRQPYRLGATTEFLGFEREPAFECILLKRPEEPIWITHDYLRKGFALPAPFAEINYSPHCESNPLSG
jgi:hypothetical protein